MISPLPLLFAVLLASPAAASRADDCAYLAGDSASELTQRHRELASVRLSGATLPDGELWNLIGGAPPLPLSTSEAIALVARLQQTGLFSSVQPQIRPLPGDESAELDIALAQEPQVASVRIRGLSEFRADDLLDRLVDAPTEREVERGRREMRDALASECPAPVPPRAWLLRLDDGQVQGGLAWHGLKPGLQRMLRYLRGRGYPLARIEGRLTADGELILDVDEGHVSEIEVRGVDPRLANEVRGELGIGRGDIFSSGELNSALDRIQRRWPFLRPDREDRERPLLPVVKVSGGPAGSLEIRSEEPPPAARDDDDDDDFDEDRPPEKLFRKYMRRFTTSRTGWYSVEDGTLVLHFRTERSATRTQWLQLLRHTPVTGFAPGLAGTATIYDPADRTHLMFDGAFNYNTRRPDRAPTGNGYLERLSAKERVDWLAGARLRMPALDIAEIGGQLHNLTDTADGWRMSAVDSYLYSALLNRADREYYRRSGYGAFITAHLFEELTLGAEYRRDRYAALPAPNGVWSVFNQSDLLYGSAPVDEGEMGSAVFRLEYHSEKTPLHKVGSMWRSPETSLIDGQPREIGLRTLDTVEVADRSLGGTFDFTKIVSDTFVSMETGRGEMLTLRVRGAGGRDLPQQKQEALGGWTALRGYDFKEFRGNASLLGTVQIEGRHFGAFLDVGSVRQVGGSWLDPKSSAGLLFSFASGSTRAEAAWRLDARGKLTPDFRVLFSVPL